MPQKKTFEDIINEAYKRCVDERDESYLRDMGLNLEVTMEYARKLVWSKVNYFGNIPLPSDPETQIEVLGEMIALVSQGFEWGWRARKIYEKS